MKIKSEVLRSLIKRVDIVAKDGRSLQLGTIKAKNNLYLQAMCSSPDETVHTVINLPLNQEQNGDEFATVIRSKEFIIADCVASLSDEDVSIEMKGTKLEFSNKISNVTIDTLLGSVNAINTDSTNTKFSLEVNREAFLAALKDASRYQGDDSLANVVMHVKKESIIISSANQCAISYATVGCKVTPGPKWEDACASYTPVNEEEEAGCDTAVPGIFISYLVSALSLSSAERVYMIVDNKYLYLRYDGYSIISVRLSERFSKLNVIRANVELPSSECFAVEKASLEAAVKLLRKRLDLNKELSAGVGIHLTLKKGVLVLSIADNKVMVPVVESSSKGITYEMYISPALLESAINICKPGNILIKKSEACKNGFICANGSVKDGFADKAVRTMIMRLHDDQSRQQEARFASGLTEKEAKQKEEKKDGVE